MSEGETPLELDGAIAFRPANVSDLDTIVALKLRMIEEAIQWLRTQGIGAVHLLASEHGRSLYQALGFLPSDERMLRLGPD